jgi:membrane-bound lytic murein transglycosylase D
MRKLVLLFMLATAPLTGLLAQMGTLDPSVTGNEIFWQLDSLMPCHLFQCSVASQRTRDSLNKYNYSLDSLPPLSSDVVEQRLRDLGAFIPLAYNDDVQAFINLYTLQRRDQVERMLGLSHVYFPIFDSALDRAGMPMELRYLPIVESALNPHARSRVGATGLWQFMLTTGQMYDLEVTSYVDERRDPYKSTEAAVRYLGNMYKTYGDWLLVVAAYNCGPGNVNKAIARSGGKRTFWEIQEYLPRETRSYVPALIAATYVFNYSTEHNLFPRPVDFSFQQDTIRIVRQQMSLKHFADVTHTDFWLLKDLNPELKIDVIPYSVTGYELRVPMKTGQFYAAFKDSIALWAATVSIDSAKVVYTDNRISPLTNRPYVSEASEEPTYGSSNTDKKIIYHKVRRGEVVGTIASRYHVTAKDISKWNGLRNYNIVAGQNLKIYVKGAAPKPQPKVVPTAATPSEPAVVKTDEAAAQDSTQVAGTVAPTAVETKAVAKVDPKANNAMNAIGAMDAKYHVVKQGDTLWHIANAYDGLTVEKLMSLNSLPSNKLEVGQKLRVQ